MSDALIPTHTPRARRRSLKSGFFHYCPLYLYLLVFFILVEQFGGDIRQPLLAHGKYAISWVEIFYLIGGVFGSIEMLKVSEARTNNLWEALTMLFSWILYFALFLMGATGAKIWFLSFELFNNTEFLMLMLLSGLQVVVAFLINASTLQVQIAE